VFLLGPWVATRGLREREDRAAALGAQLERERAQQQRLRRDIVTTERARIARELHDVVAHSVSVMVIQLGAARMSLQSCPQQAEEPLEAAAEVGRDALAELRRLLAVLRAEDGGQSGTGATPAPPQPGLTQLPSLMATARTAGIEATVATSGTPVPLTPGLDLTAYRIVQEALTNTLKHAHAQHFTVRLSYASSVLDIDIADDGLPLAAPGRRDAAGGDGDLGVLSGGGHGLVGIRERAALFGGDASIGPAADGGWRVHARLPLGVDAPLAAVTA
jgi:signal transduction histidine kinase